MIPALVLAAGLSTRMRRFKLSLPWAGTTVIGQVVATLEAAGVDPVVVVVGNRSDEVAAALYGSGAQLVMNPSFADGEMLSSLKVGLLALGTAVPAALLCLGDQPQMEIDTVRDVLACGQSTGWSKVIIPSFRMRAGHPILLPRFLWPEILASAKSLRSVLAQHLSNIEYLVVDRPSILQDLDTPRDYKHATGHETEKP